MSSVWEDRNAEPDAGGDFTEIRRVRSFDGVVAQIQGAILSGRYRPGDRLPTERELCDLFAVSRPTVREALRALEVLGTLEIRSGKRGGIFVASPSGEAVGIALSALIGLQGATAAELDEFRASFEGSTAACAAARGGDDDLDAISSLAEQAVALSEEEDAEWKSMVAIDLAFHHAIAVASHNRVRLAVMLGLLRAVQRVEYTITSIVDQALLRSVGDELTAVAGAIRARDAEGARAAMGRHVERFGAMYARMQDQPPAAAAPQLRATPP